MLVACGEDPHTIEAVGRAGKEGIMEAVLTGDKAAIKRVTEQHRVASGFFEIEDEA